MIAAPVANTLGEDITPLVNAAAERHGLDPVHLLALLQAESGLNPRAERWGRKTSQAQAAIAYGDRHWLQQVIDAVWPDISFGMSQRIVLYHEAGDRSRSADNCLIVRQYVFSDPAEDVEAAAQRLAGCFRHWSCDGTPLSAMVVYNAGSDRRGDAAWMRDWAGNVASYQRELTWAEQYRVEDGMTAAQKDTVLTAASQLETIALRQQRAAAAVATVGAGEPWQYRDLLAERDAEELRALALRLQQAAGE